MRRLEIGVYKLQLDLYLNVLLNKNQLAVEKREAPELNTESNVLSTQH